MPSNGEIIERAVNEFSRIQTWMQEAKENNEMKSYATMRIRYIELKVTLSNFGVNLTELDRIKE